MSKISWHKLVTIENESDSMELEIYTNGIFININKDNKKIANFHLDEKDYKFLISLLTE